MVNYLKWAFVGIGGLAVGLLGGWDKALEVLVFLVVADYATGLIAAYIEKKLNSEVGARGILKKLLIFFAVALGYMVDQAIGATIFRSLVIFFYIANEGLSIIENLGRAGLPIPEVLKAALEQMKQKSEQLPPVTSQYQNQNRQQDK